jgi:hypothetical protein
MKNFISAFIDRHGKAKSALVLFVIVLVLALALAHGVDAIPLND